MKKVIIGICLVLLVLVSVCVPFNEAYAEETRDNKSMALIVINRLDFRDIDEMEFLKGISNDNAISLINTRAYQLNNEYSSNLTIGSGTRSNASTTTSRMVEINDEIKDVYYLRNNKVLESGRYVNIDTAALQELNKKNNYRPFIGALGDSFKEMNVPIYLYGNSSTTDREVSFGSLIAMDSKGVVKNGEIGIATNTITSKAPFGIKTNYEFMLERLKEKKDGLYIMELGDLYRLDRYKGYLSEDAYTSTRRKTIEEIDGFLKEAIQSIRSDMDVMIVSPTVSVKRYAMGERLAPLVYVSSEGDSSSLMLSPTTRREGIIANLDIAPYITDYFGGDKSNYIGKSFKLISSEDNYEFVKKLSRYTAFIYMNRAEVLSTFAIYEILVVIFIFVLLQLKNKGRIKANILYRCLILSNIAIPIALLIMPIFWPDNLFKCITLLFIITAVLTTIAIAFKKKRIDGVILLTGFTCVLLAVDIVMGSNLIKNGFLGYDPIIGARYYGIGNEYMGILIGCTLVFSTAILDRFKISKWTAAIIYVLIIIAIGYPGFGANVGGAITAVFAFLFVMFKLFKGKLELKHFGILVISVPVFIAALAIIDLYLIKDSSHLGNAINQIRAGGIDVIVSIIIRKVSMNIRLFNVSIWSKVLVISLGVLGLLFYRPFGVAKEVFNKYQNLKIGLLGLIVACLVTFVVNDSGVVAAATAVIPLVMTLLYLVFVEIRDI